MKIIINLLDEEAKRTIEDEDENILSLNDFIIREITYLGEKFNIQYLSIDIEQK